ncbi:MAG: M20/M25/M40 family metallo-hydrolase [Verrucomicrobiae bacterium]|nr:M20/M25/M40 family metallo-hydrolase [Verrucomicrobiae bacterium]
MFALSDSEFEEAKNSLRELLLIDTSNPPGDERPAAELIARWLREEGLNPELVGADPERPNLVCRLAADPTNRSARPLVLSSHLDVVPADASRWTHPPFGGVEADGCLWGRGAIDMKGFAIMALSALLSAKRHGFRLNRDLIFAAVADEEAGATLGSQWLVENRPDLLGGEPEYVINEVGGFTLHRPGKRFYPVQVAEKGIAWLRLSVGGTPGHSSLPDPDNALATLANAIARIANAKLPWHVTDPARAFIGGMARESGTLAKLLTPALLNTISGPYLLPLGISETSRRRSVEAILRNTANPTRIHRGGTKINVIPGHASVDIDGRLVPGQTADDLIAELSTVLGDPGGERFQFEILQTSEAAVFPSETPLFEAIRDLIHQRDPEGMVVPSMIPGFTDSKNYARLGATCYGFYPLQLPKDLDFAAMFHGDDERIPLDGFRWGVDTLTELIRGFACR